MIGGPYTGGGWVYLSSLCEHCVNTEQALFNTRAHNRIEVELATNSAGRSMCRCLYNDCSTIALVVLASR